MKLASILLTCTLACALPNLSFAAPQAGRDVSPPPAELPTTLAAQPAAPAAWELSADEFDELTQAQAQAGELADLRGGAITNDDLLTILLIAGIIILIAIIV